MDVKSKIEFAAANPYDGQPPVGRSRVLALTCIEELRTRRGFEIFNLLEKPLRIEIIDALAAIIAGPGKVEQPNARRSTEAA